MGTLRGICILNTEKGETKGVVGFKEQSLRGPVEIRVKLWDVPTGFHGAHIHRSGNLTDGAHTLCTHYNPTNQLHGDLNGKHAHIGDLGNLSVDRNGECDAALVAEKLNLRDVFGRGLIVHADQDDLGKGGYPDSKSNGHSGARMLFGIIGRDEDCEE